MSLADFLKRLGHALVGVPVELIAGLWRVLLLLLLLLLHAGRFLLELFGKLFGDAESPPDREHCNEVPPHVKRKPDPCLYSQFYLQTLGLAVTWDNPDIWITLPDLVTVVESSQLQADTDYVVHARIHDASFDPALATEVRCFYRPWSFNSPERIPIETEADGTERVVILHIPPWHSDVAQFKWHTPNTPGAHYCLQVECRHPDDKNPNNNLGQENTTLQSAAAGAQVTAAAMLWNPQRRRAAVRLRADTYAIPKGDIELRLEKRERLLVPRSREFARVQGWMLTKDMRQGLVTAKGHSPRLISYVYRGWDKVLRSSARGSFPDPANWDLTVDGVPAQRDALIEIEPGQSRAVAVTVTIPPESSPGTIHHFNISAYDAMFKLMGGITMRVEAQ